MIVQVVSVQARNQVYLAKDAILVLDTYDGRDSVIIACFW
jgi:hypothetical protein